MNLFEQFSNSLWNFKAYGRLAHIKRGRSFLYFFVFFTVVFLIFSIKAGMDASAGIEDLRLAMKNDVPDFELSNGEFYFEGEMPYTVQEGATVFIIDTTGATTEEALDNTYEGMLITRDTLYQKNNGRLQIISLADFPFHISKQSVINFLPGLMAWVYVGLFLFYLISFGGKLFSILVLALITMIATAIFNQKLSFGSHWNIAIYAATLPSILQLLNNTLDHPLGSFSFYIYWAVAITYAFLGVYGISQANRSEILVSE